jgi:tetratricopeptide (TPR) repeat protein
MIRSARYSRTLAGAVCLLWVTGIQCASKTVQGSGALDTPEAAYARGRQLLEEGAYAGAAAAFERARTLSAGYAPAYEGLSRAAFAQGKTDEAIRHIRMAKTKDPAYAPAWTVTGMLYGSVKRYKEAVAEFQEALRADPDNLWATETYVELGKVLEQMGALEEAHEAFMNALALDPLHLEARDAVVRVRSALGPAFLMRLRYEGKDRLTP